MHEVLVNRLGGLSLPRKSVVRLTDRPNMTLDVYRGRKTTIQQQQYENDLLTWSLSMTFLVRPLLLRGMIKNAGKVLYLLYYFTFFYITPT